MSRIAFLAALLALSACASTAPTSFQRELPDVSSEETSFFSSSIRNVYRGDGDVIFVQAAGRWYRTLLNEGCLDGVSSSNPGFAFGSEGTSKVDRFTRVYVMDGGGMPLQCQVRSVRESLPPPMVDSASVVPRS